MATQEIVYRINVDNKEAIRAFNDLMKTQQGVEKSTQKLGNITNNSNMLLMSTGRIVQDMPFGFMAVGNNITFMAEQMAYMRTQGMSTKDMLTGMVGALKGPGGAIFAISLITSAITYFSMQSGKASGEVDKLTKAFDEMAEKLIKLKSPFKQGFFEFTPEQMQGAIDKLQAGITAIENKSPFGAPGLGQQIPFAKDVSLWLAKTFDFINKNDKESLDRQNKLKEVFKDRLTQLQAEKEIMEMLSGLGGDWKEKTEGTKKDYGEINDLLQEALDTMLKMPVFRTEDRMKPFRQFWVGGVKEVRAPTLGFTDAEVKRDFLKENQMLVDTIQTTAGVLRSEFSSAWQSIFGEADSLFEKLLMSITEKLASNWLTELGGGLLNWLVPGLGSAAGMAFGSSAPMIQNKIVISDREIATIYSMGREQASRLRI